jgi:hypothetical protein
MKSAGLSRLLSNDPTRKAIKATINSTEREYFLVVRLEGPDHVQRSSDSCSPPGTTRFSSVPDAFLDGAGERRGEVLPTLESGFVRG